MKRKLSLEADRKNGGKGFFFIYDDVEFHFFDTRRHYSLFYTVLCM